MDTNGKIPFILCGNKLDLKHEYSDLYVSNKTAEELTNELINIKGCLQCSAQEDIRRNEEYIGTTNNVFEHAIKEAIIFKFGLIERSKKKCFNCILL